MISPTSSPETSPKRNYHNFLDKVDQDIAHWYALYPDAPRVDYTTRVLDGHVGEGYGRASEAVFDTIAELAALEGLRGMQTASRKPRIVQIPSPPDR